MSLLIKALEQAAKDRKTGPLEAQPDSPAASAPVEPTLEPPPPPRTPARVRDHAPAGEPTLSVTSRTATAEHAPSTTTAAASPTAPALALDRGASQRRSSAAAAGLAQIDAQQQRARAAAVMQAGGGSAANVIAFLRGNPLIAFAALAGLFGIGFGVYVYLQISNPGMFVRPAAPRPQQSAPASPAPSQPQAAGSPESPPPATPAAAAVPATELPPAGHPIPTSSGAITTPSPAVPVTPPAPAPLPTASVIATAPPADLPRALATERIAPSNRERNGARAEPQQATPASAVAEPRSSSREGISVSSSNVQPRLNPMLTHAYTLLQAGNLEEARAVYGKIAQAEPLNVDALLGLAYVAAQENRTDEAVKLYLRILQLNPRHALAQAALIGLMGRADPAASESRLKQLIAREPSAFLHFVLGNFYAEQSQWSQAQQSYFQAHHLDSENPDYAYNLAVGLDHLRQGKVALNFYRRAEQLASTRGQSNFSLAHARERIRALSSQLE